MRLIEKTGWYSGEQKPVRKGLYEREYFFLGKRIINYCYWNGKNWCSGALTRRAAMMDRYLGSLQQNLRWRGLTEKLSIILEDL